MAVSSKLITWRGNAGITEASDCGWPAGHFPEAFEVKSGRTGHIEPFREPTKLMRRNEFIGYRYRSPRGLYLTVFND